MIDHVHHAIFIHQQKVAGMSIMSACQFSPDNPDFHRFNDGVLSKEWQQRSEQERNYFVFSAVRNPFDRLISSWKYLDATRNRTLLDVLQNPPREGHDYRHLTRPQVAILRGDGSSKLIVDDLIRFETLQRDFDRICDRIGRPRVTLPHRNATQRAIDYRDCFDARTRRMAEDIFGEDMATFDYEF